MRDGTLTYAWVRAEAALPLQWILMGVVRGPRDAEALMPAGVWTAWAKGPREGQEAAGTGESPQAALRNLAKRLAELRGTLSG